MSQIQNAKYVKNSPEEAAHAVNCIIDGIPHSVPINPDNRHYKAIQEWVAEGNTIQEAD